MDNVTKGVEGVSICSVTRGQRGFCIGSVTRGEWRCPLGSVKRGLGNFFIDSDEMDQRGVSRSSVTTGL
jgi:hypothetical protein